MHHVKKIRLQNRKQNPAHKDYLKRLAKKAKTLERKKAQHEKKESNKTPATAPQEKRTVSKT